MAQRLNRSFAYFFPSPDLSDWRHDGPLWSVKLLEPREGGTRLSRHEATGKVEPITKVELKAKVSKAAEAIR